MLDDGGAGTLPCVLVFDSHSTSRTVVSQVEPQAFEHNKKETFNVDLFRKLGTLSPEGLGILGLTVEEQYNGTNFDATAVALVHEELSYSDPAFCLSYLAHSLLFVNNLSVNGTHSQKKMFLPAACDGSKIGGMGMSEPNAGTDVLGMRTNAALDESAGGWILNGSKVGDDFSYMWLDFS